MALVLREESGVIGKHPSERSLDEHLQYGVAIIDKPVGPSSHETSSFVRKILHIKKTGHTGTLDQNVSGVLVVLLEDSCKAAHFLMGDKKKYSCIMRTKKLMKKEELENAFSNFVGKIYQKPPLASAVAKRLRVREVHSLNILGIQKKDVLFECECDAGTYIRNIVYDAGEVLGTETEMLELRRTKAGGFFESSAVTLQQLSDYYWLAKERNDESFLRKSVVPIEDVILMKRIVISDSSLKKIANGSRVSVSDVLELDEGIREDGERIAIFTKKGELFCFAESLSSSSQIERASKEGKKELAVAAPMRVMRRFY